MFEDIAAIAAGYLFSVVVGYLVIQQVMEAAWRGVLAPIGADRAGKARPHPEHGQAIGLVERTLYTAAWQLDVRAFVAVWLAVKAVGAWRGPGEDRPLPLEVAKVPGPAAFNLFLIGSGLSLAFGIAGGLVIDWLARDAWAEALLLAIALAGASFGLRWFLGRKPASAA